MQNTASVLEALRSLTGWREGARLDRQARRRAIFDSMSEGEERERIEACKLLSIRNELRQKGRSRFVASDGENLGKQPPS